MGKQTVEILQCDICGRKSKPEENHDKWLQWSQDDRVLDRHWHERCACPSCTSDIKNAINRLGR
jgi:hypothetical protein